MSRYEARVLLKGMTERDRRIARIKDDMISKIIHNPSYKKNALITDSYGDERHVGMLEIMYIGVVEFGLFNPVPQMMRLINVDSYGNATGL